MSLDIKVDTILNVLIDMKSEQARQGEQIDRNTEDLKDHIEGVRQNRIRIESLEKSKERSKGVIKFLGVAASVIAGVAAVATALIKYL